jgi:hypothetical protein
MPNGLRCNASTAIIAIPGQVGEERQCLHRLLTPWDREFIENVSPNFGVSIGLSPASDTTLRAILGVLDVAAAGMTLLSWWKGFMGLQA